MSSEERREDRQFFARWVRGTFFGWLVLSLHSGRANWWVFACVAGWTLAAGTAASGSIFDITFLGRSLNLRTILWAA